MDSLRLPRPTHWPLRFQRGPQRKGSPQQRQVRPSLQEPRLGPASRSGAAGEHCEVGGQALQQGSQQGAAHPG